MARHHHPSLCVMDARRPTQGCQGRATHARLLLQPCAMAPFTLPTHPNPPPGAPGSLPSRLYASRRRMRSRRWAASLPCWPRWGRCLWGRLSPRCSRQQPRCAQHSMLLECHQLQLMRARMLLCALVPPRLRPALLWAHCSMHATTRAWHAPPCQQRCSFLAEHSWWQPS